MRASFSVAIAWLALNDDCAWIYDDDWVAPMTAMLVSDVFGKEAAFIRHEVKKCRVRKGLPHAR